jgi:DNA-binding response OmpR family regulator
MAEEKKILIIEDDPDIAELVEINVKDIGFELVKENNGKEGLKTALDNKFELIILDLMLPGLNGMEVCKQIREKDTHTPILMLTAKSEELDKVLGLEKGADDYLTKPFSIRELLARIKANIRRVKVDAEFQEEALDDTFEFGDLYIESQKRKVTLSGEKIELTPKEFDLLILFASSPGKTYSREALLEKVWGYQFDGYDHTVNSHINRLRNKIEKDPPNPTYLKTVWGVGYRFVELQELEQ